MNATRYSVGLLCMMLGTYGCLLMPIGSPTPSEPSGSVRSSPPSGGDPSYLTVNPIEGTLSGELGGVTATGTADRYSGYGAGDTLTLQMDTLGAPHGAVMNMLTLPVANAEAPVGTHFAWDPTSSRYDSLSVLGCTGPSIGEYSGFDARAQSVVVETIAATTPGAYRIAYTATFDDGSATTRMTHGEAEFAIAP